MIKNVKINKTFFNGKEKKTKLLNKTKIFIVAISTAVAISGCSNRSNNINTKGYKNNTYNTSTSLNEKESSEETAKEEYEYNDWFDYSNYSDYSTYYLEPSSDTYNYFMDYINSIETKYYYDTFYGVDEAFDKYENAKNSAVTMHSNHLDNISVEELYTSVKNNNKEYLLQKKKEYIGAFYEEFSDDKLREICEIIIGEVKFYENKITDIEEVKCILGNLKIFSKSTMTNAYITDDDCLIVSPDMINTLTIRSSSKNQDVFKDTLCHETNHILQKSCQDNLKYQYRIGNSYKFDDLEINPLFCNWFYEASAEKLSNNYTGDTPLVYPYYVNYIESISLSTILGENNYVGQIEESTLTKSYDALFNAFDCKSVDDKKEIIKMLFSLDIVERDNEEFIKLIGLDTKSDEYISVKRNIKTSICETLTKSFYKNLATLVKNNHISLQEVYYLITVFENDLDYHLNYSTEEKYEDNRDFINTYIDIQSNFFEYLASGIKYSKEEIEELFNNYDINKTPIEDNNWLSFLDLEKKELIEKIRERLKYNKTEQIMDTYLKINRITKTR